jgi:HK97 family phage prohead protease
MVTAVNEKTNPPETVHKTGHQSDDNPNDYIMSTEHVDRMGDVIRVKGWELEEFRKSPIALFGHDHTLPIGKWTNVRIVGKQLIGTLELAKQGTSDFIDTIRSLVEQRILKAVSVGFQPIEANPMKSTGGLEFTRASLHECSLVSVPANPNALAIAKALSPHLANIVFAESGSSVAGEDGRLAFDSTTPNLSSARERMKGLGIR